MLSDYSTGPFSVVGIPRGRRSSRRGMSTSDPRGHYLPRQIQMKSEKKKKSGILAGSLCRLHPHHPLFSAASPPPTAASLQQPTLAYPSLSLYPDLFSLRFPHSRSPSLQQNRLSSPVASSRRICTTIVANPSCVAATHHLFLISHFLSVAPPARPSHWQSAVHRPPSTSTNSRPLLQPSTTPPSSLIDDSAFDQLNHQPPPLYEP